MHTNTHPQAPSNAQQAQRRVRRKTTSPPGKPGGVALVYTEITVADGATDNCGGWFLPAVFGWSGRGWQRRVVGQLRGGMVDLVWPVGDWVHGEADTA